MVATLIEALDEVFEQGHYADKVIQRHLKSQKQWGSRDRRFFAESLYEIVRWERLLAYMVDDNDFWKIWAAYWIRQGNELPDWEEFADISVEDARARAKNIPSFAVAQSIPDWMAQRLEQELGDGCKEVVRALNQPADVFLRTNTLKITPTDLIKKLADEGIEATLVSSDLPQAVKLSERRNIFITKVFKEGLFEVQDAASQMVAPLLDVQPGQRVVDACAGGGGKSLHLATLMKNKGKILSLDIHDWKLNELKIRARRNSVDIIETRLIDSTKVIKRLHETADRLLLDVPCSGIGVIRRNPDAKWKLSLEEIERLHQLQHEILTSYSAIVKNGGKMVYATCSLLPSENEQQVQKFLKDHGAHWTLLQEMHLRPDREGYDGFYGAVLQRK
jgi:16S rRNA (cytosine967-C5)-methyltransferase